MKKITLLIISLFTVGFLAAQNTATTTTTGNQNDSKIVQTGDDQTSTVMQTGDYNESDVNQDNSADVPSELGSQTADVDQVGDYNDADIDMNMKKGKGAPNKAEIMQEGDRNKSSQKFLIDFNNKNNTATGYQKGDHNELDQIIDGGHGEGLDASQVGDYNSSYQKSSGSAIRGKVVQTGDHNDAYQKLGSRSLGYYTTPGSGPILIDQVGSYNKGRQDFSGRNLSGQIKQTGDRNESRQTIDGQMDETFAEIDGDRNYTKQTIDGGRNGSGSPSNLSEVFIDGNWNDVRTTQEGSFNSTRVDINGDVHGHVGDASRNDVDVDQIGDYNTLSFTIPRGDVGGDYNDLNADQTGNGHLHRVGVDGSHNDIDILSTGNDGGSQYAGNKGDWSISDDAPGWSETSDYNKLYLNQDGKQNFATGAVAGDHNDIDIRQSGEGNMVGSTWSSTDGVMITGNRNEVDIRQTGLMGHSATVNQTGNRNTSTTIQTP